MFGKGEIWTMSPAAAPSGARSFQQAAEDAAFALRFVFADRGELRPGQGRITALGFAAQRVLAQPREREREVQRLGLREAECLGAYLLIRKVDQKVLRRSVEPATDSIEKLNFCCR